MGGSETIVATGLTKLFGDVVAVKGLSLSIGVGEIYGFLGLNGAGKTTTIRMLLGMIRPSAGSARLFGTRVQPGQQRIWQQVGYMVETPHAYPDLTVRENLEIVRRLRHLNEGDEVQQIMRELGLIQYADRRTRTLSLGNAQRLGLAKALIHHPQLLILDEPGNALDPAGIVEIRTLLRSLAINNGVTILISSHILSEVARLATRIGVIHNGHLVKELDARELANQEELRLIIDVVDTGAALSALKRAGIVPVQEGQNSLVITDRSSVQHPDNVATLLVHAGCPPTGLLVERRDLEAYFLNLVGMKEVGK